MKQLFFIYWATGSTGLCLYGQGSQRGECLLWTATWWWLPGYKGHRQNPVVSLNWGKEFWNTNEATFVGQNPGKDRSTEGESSRDLQRNPFRSLTEPWSSCLFFFCLFFFWSSCLDETPEMEQRITLKKRPLNTQNSNRARAYTRHRRESSEGNHPHRGDRVDFRLQAALTYLKKAEKQSSKGSFWFQPTNCVSGQRSILLKEYNNI